MSLLKIRRVSESEERCWGVELLDDAGPLLRSREGAGQGDVMSIATTLKSEGPAAPLLEDDKVQPGQAAWVIAKARGGWVVRFTPVAATSFDLLLKPETRRRPPQGGGGGNGTGQEVPQRRRERSASRLAPPVPDGLPAERRPAHEPVAGSAFHRALATLRVHAQIEVHLPPFQQPESVAQPVVPAVGRRRQPDPRRPH